VTTADAHPATFVARDNRFVVRARRPDGEVVRAYLPNTARLTDVLVPDARLALQPAASPQRRTRWTVTRVWDGTWVALAAGTAADLVADHLTTGGTLPGWPPTVALRREVTRDGHRFDLEVDRADGVTGVVEVKSLSRVRNGLAPLSGTPSTRGMAHLATLGRLARTGTPTAAVFVVQRGDARALDLGAPADPGWVRAVREAQEAGVAVVAHACRVEVDTIVLGEAVPVRDDGT
jgi:sugar fermentation stimulation protein A